MRYEKKEEEAKVELILNPHSEQLIMIFMALEVAYNMLH